MNMFVSKVMCCGINCKTKHLIHINKIIDSQETQFNEQLAKLNGSLGEKEKEIEALKKKLSTKDMEMEQLKEEFRKEKEEMEKEVIFL